MATFDMSEKVALIYRIYNIVMVYNERFCLNLILNTFDTQWIPSRREKFVIILI